MERTNRETKAKHRNRILIVGGVAGGASCATRARRLCERCEIVMFDRGPYVSFANCGLPYHVGDVIEDERALLVATPEFFRDRFDIEVHTLTEVTAIDREGREIEVRDLHSGEVRREPYDALVLSPGARAIRPPLPGIDLPHIHVVRTIQTPGVFETRWSVLHGPSSSAAASSASRWRRTWCGAAST